MESGKHALQGTLASNKIHPFLMVRVPMKYGKWQGSMASGSKIWDVNEEYRINEILPVV